MFRAKKILLACSFILIVCLSSDAQSYAQSKEATNPPAKRFQISFGGGWGLYNMNNINKHYIDDFADEVGIFDDQIDNGPNLFGEVGYFISSDVSANAGVTYLHGSTSKKDDVIRTDEYGNLLDTLLGERTLTTTLVAPHLKIKYHFPLEKIDLFLGGGGAWCFGRSSLRSTGSGAAGREREQTSYSNEYKFTAQGLGFLASAGASYDLNETLSIGAEVGYRHYTTGDLKDKDGDAWEVQWLPTYYKMNLDFSGPFILGTLSIRL